jgi:hypothetical protein
VPVVTQSIWDIRIAKFAEYRIVNGLKVKSRDQGKKVNFRKREKCGKRQVKRTKASKTRVKVERAWKHGRRGRIQQMNEKKRRLE